ncbi:MAG: hypothetical protein ACRD15_06545 [Vicinamibacterales bacterium]
MFVNLPVRDLEKSMAFLSTLGFTFNPRFTGERAACRVLSDDRYVMPLTEPFFWTFTRGRSRRSPRRRSRRRPRVPGMRRRLR